MRWFRHLQLRWKLLIMVMPLVLIPLLLVAIIVSNISIGLAYDGITRASMDDLKHMSEFSLDLLHGHYRQYEVYQQERETAARQKLGNIVDLAYNLVQTHHEQFISLKLPLNSVRRAARSGLKFASVGEGGYISVMDGEGTLLIHPDSEGKVVFNSQDENGRFFVKEMYDSALAAAPGEVLYTKYLWKNPAHTGQGAREKVVAYRFFPEWGWIISAESNLDEIYKEKPFEDWAFFELKKQIKEKKVGKTGFISIADCSGNYVIHPQYEGQSVSTWLDKKGQEELRKLCENKDEPRWSRSLQYQSLGVDPRARLARLDYFSPWDWVVYVEAYEDELYCSATETKKHILASVIFLGVFVSGFAGLLTFYVTRHFTFPIFKMTEQIGKAKGSRMVRKISVPDGDELKKLAIAFNTMSDLVQRDRLLEEKLAKVEKMASIGVLSSGVAHEINNPMGVILGYACHLEKKLDKEDSNYHFVQEIKQETKRCVRIVQHLLDYAKAPNLVVELTSINVLIDQIVDFAASHVDMEKIVTEMVFASNLPQVEVDGDQLRQVFMNLILNAAAAMKGGGTMRITTASVEAGVQIEVADTGQGISTENLGDVFEPFFTTKSKGTGLGLAISKQIIDAHMGTINIQSKVGEGTIVRVIVPVK